MYHMGRKTEPLASIRAPLTELESEIMNAVWNGGSCSVEDVHRVVSKTRELKEATIRTLLRRLETKGYLSHTTDGRAYIYAPRQSARVLAGRAVRQIIDRFCRGSLDQLVRGMVDDRILSDEELQSLQHYAKTKAKSGGA
jgi:BlaI family penicillinase repressor